jgi:hypothetical protein
MISSKNELINALSQALDTQIDENASTLNVEEWDSLGHLAILQTLDEATQGKSSNIPGLAAALSLNDIYELLKKHGLVN